MTRKTLTLTAAAIALTVPAMAVAQVQGKAQLADILGVEAGNFTLSQLVRLDEAFQQNNENEVRLILEESGSDSSPTELMSGYGDETMMSAASWYTTDYETGKEQIADQIGVPAEEFTLAQLVRLDNAVAEGRETEIDTILDEAGVSMTAGELLR